MKMGWLLGQTRKLSLPSVVMKMGSLLEETRKIGVPSILVVIEMDTAKPDQETQTIQYFIAVGINISPAETMLCPLMASSLSSTP